MAKKTIMDVMHEPCTITIRSGKKKIAKIKFETATAAIVGQVPLRQAIENGLVKRIRRVA